MQRSSPSLQPLLDEEADMSQPSAPTQSWDQLRKEARTLEGEIESQLASLSKMGQSTTTLEDGGQEAKTDELLKKVRPFHLFFFCMTYFFFYISM